MAYKVLVIDDEPNIVRLVKARLNANGYEVISASNGKEGLEIARQQLPDLILLDIMMPQMNGEKTLIELKKDIRTQKIPVIMLTAKQDADDIVRCIHDLGASDYVVKPFVAGEFLRKINTVVSGTQKVPESIVEKDLMDTVEDRIRKALDGKNKSRK
ncbi:MAG: response regulator [Candidatus Omnitrophica bacterium]|nr:response regulator [Candidatus Omnitrophota bacterium]